MKIPPALKKNDTIGLLCPSGYMPLEKAQTCINTLQQWGYKVKVGKTLGKPQQNYFSGTDEERLTDLQQMLDDNNIKAILCARGGYGLSRIIDKLDFKKFNKKPKWIIGFSDITVLHAHLNNVIKTATLHSPMAAAFNDDGFKNEYVISLQKALQGKLSNYKTAAHVFNKKGIAKAELVGGNLCLIAHLAGTKSCYNTKAKILFLEDIGEYLYNIDRMFLQLKRAGLLNNLKGLIIGKFSDTKDTEATFGKTAYEIINEHVKEYNYPVCYNFPVSHETENYALKVGVQYELKVTKNKVTLKQL